MTDTQKKPLLRRLRYALETVLVYILYAFFRLLPIRAASGFSGWICRSIGPHLPSSAVARKNLARVFPGKSADEREKIVAGMWDNLGRVLAEYAHLHRIWDYVELAGKENLDKARAGGGPVMFFAAHLANWEICSIGVKRAGFNVYPVYRRPNNPGVEGLLRYARGTGSVGLIAKGAAGAREMLTVLKNKGALGIMMDQKLNEGMAISFFGRPAMTAPAIASFALRFECQVLPVRIERLGGVRFKITVYPRLEIPRSGDKEQDTRAILTEINRQFENWIRERPEQWLWIHRRWPD
ncbi:MAG: lauroyl acyltransferase [Alphaproteobacteria bacterium]|nr:lauroyl acyltransferase [Alphaproteobacteria bacterium]